MDPSDHDLLRQYVRDDSQTAFAELVRRHLDLVYSAARRQVGSSGLAEEIAQSVFLDLSRNSTRIKPGSPLVAWLHVVTRRTAIDVIRRESRRQSRERTAVEIDLMNPSPSVWTEVAPLLDEALEKLSETDRTAVLLRYFQNKSLREVGESLGASEEAAQKRVVRAIDRLRNIFAKRGITVGAAGLTTELSAHAIEAAPAGFAKAVTLRTAAAKAAGGAALTLAHFMATKTAITLAGVVLAVALAGWSWHLGHSSPTLNDSASDAPAATRSMKAVSVVSGTNPPVAASAPATTVPPVAEISGEGTRSTRLYRLDNPEYRRKAMERSKTNIDRFYGPLFSHLNLPADQLDRLKDLLVEKQMVRADAERAARDNGILRADDDEGFYAAIAIAQRDVDARLKATLGDAGYEDYASYERSFAKRMTVQRFRDSLSDSEPLSDEQANKLVDLLVTTRKSDNVRDTVGLGIGIGAGDNPLTFGLINMETVRAAKEFLSPTQFQALKDLRAQLQIDKAKKELGSSPNPQPTDPLARPKN